MRRKIKAILNVNESQAEIIWITLFICLFQLFFRNMIKALALSAILGVSDATMLRDVAGAPKPPPKSKGGASLCTGSWTETNGFQPEVNNCVSVTSIQSSCTGTAASSSWIEIGGPTHTFSCNTAATTVIINAPCDGRHAYDFSANVATGTTETIVASWVPVTAGVCSPVGTWT